MELEKFIKIVTRIKKRLGAPILIIELTDEHYQEAVDTAEESFAMFSQASLKTPTQLEKIRDTWIFQYSLAICKEMLGRIRGKFEKAKTPDGDLALDFKALLKESENEKNFLFRVCMSNSVEGFVLLNRKNV